MGCMDGKVAIVTGGGRGIGREECLLLAREGARVVVNDFGGALDGCGGECGPADEVVAAIREAGGEAAASHEDVTGFEAARKIIDCALENFGRLDALINNAGILRDRTVYNMTEEEFDSVIAVHLKGHFSCTRWAAAHWRAESKAGRGSPRHIVNTTSAAGLIGNRGQTNYGAAKAGIANMSLIWAQELERIGVTVNAIAPIARTRITEATFGAMEVEEGEFDAMDPANIAPLAVFLASDLAGETSGQVFGLHGGALECYEPWTSVACIEQDERWSLEALERTVPQLVLGRVEEPKETGETEEANQQQSPPRRAPGPDKAMIGREAEGATLNLEAESAKEFARAVGETDPLYLDAEAARAAGYDNVLVPPTYPIAFMAESMNADLFFDLGLDMPSIVHGGQEFEYFRPLVAGQKLRLKARIADIWGKEGRSGTLDFVVMEATAHDEKDEPVYTSRITLISKRREEGPQEHDGEEVA